MTAVSQAPAGTTGKQSNAPRASSVRRQGPQRGRTARSTKYGEKIDSNELRELVIASELVPTGHSKKVAAPPTDLDSLSTAAPSAEQSPDLTCMESALKSWPPLPTAEDGWNFCGEASDINDIWEDLPEPALAIEGMKPSGNDDDLELGSPPRTQSWWLIPGFGLTENTLSLADRPDVAPKLTFAGLLQDQQAGHFPSAHGIVAPAMRKRAAQRLSITIAVNGDPTVPDEMEEQMSSQWHGWTKQHKGTWSAKQCRKVADRKWQRREQRRQTCTGLEQDVKETV